ncbi:MAG: adenylosuccinate lyase family protein [Cryomorphaceae bacterium]|nr:MAG: adenylosuccinate lyase family protein [Cryomorphaceae bacterium]
MPSTILDSSYYRDMFGTAAMRAVFSDEARLEAWLQTEVALARAQVATGVIPAGTDEKIASAARIENIDQDAMKAEFDKVGFPILPFVKQLTRACDQETARWVHYGATTQDILDTGAVLQIREALQLVSTDLNACITALMKLAAKHRNTVMAGRTFQQQAAPITFGYKAAVWLDELLRHHNRLHELRKRVLVGQCAGAVGTFATLGEKGPAVQQKMMEHLELSVPDITWHTARDRWSELLGFLALCGATLGKIAQEVAILMRSEIGELSEPFETGRGASTTLPQKRNPIACEPVIANAHRLRELASSQMIAMMQEHERGVGHMHVEWMVVPDAFVLMSGSLHHTRLILENLWVGAEQMRANLDMGGGLLMSEAVMMGLAPLVGKSEAHHLVYAAAGRAMDQKTTLREALLADDAITAHLTVARIDELLDPANYTGMAGNMVDTVLKQAEKALQNQ